MYKSLISVFLIFLSGLLGMHAHHNIIFDENHPSIGYQDDEGFVYSGANFLPAFTPNHSSVQGGSEALKGKKIKKSGPSLLFSNIYRLRGPYDIGSYMTENPINYVNQTLRVDGETERLKRRNENACSQLSTFNNFLNNK